MIPSIDLKRLRRSAANSGVGLSSAEPTFKKFARCASKFGSTDTGSLIFSASDESLNLLYDVVVNEFETATISARTNRRAQYFIIFLFQFVLTVGLHFQSRLYHVLQWVTRIQLELL